MSCGHLFLLLFFQLAMNAACARCNKPVYPVEKMTCLDKVRTLRCKPLIHMHPFLSLPPLPSHSLKDMAQGVLLLRDVRIETHYEDVQRLQQATILLHVSVSERAFSSFGSARMCMCGCMYVCVCAIMHRAAARVRRRPAAFPLCFPFWWRR